VPKDVPDWTTGTDIPWIFAGSHVTTGAGPDAFQVGPVPRSTRILAVARQGNATPITGLVVVGADTGTEYEHGFTMALSRAWALFRVNGALDVDYGINWQTAPGPGTTISVWTSALELGSPNLGQQIMASSLPVVIASDQPAIPVTSSGTSDVDANIDEWGGVATSLGQNVAASSLPVVLASDQVIGKSGQAAMAASAPVVIASDQSAARWQAPNQPPLSFGLIMVANTAQTLIAAPGVGVTLTLAGIYIVTDTTCTVTLDDVVINYLQLVFLVNAPPVLFDFKGAPAGGPNRLLEITASVGCILRGIVLYDKR